MTTFFVCNAKQSGAKSGHLKGTPITPCIQLQPRCVTPVPTRSGRPSALLSSHRRRLFTETRAGRTLGAAAGPPVRPVPCQRGLGGAPAVRRQLSLRRGASGRQDWARSEARADAVRPTDHTRRESRPRLPVSDGHASRAAPVCPSAFTRGTRLSVCPPPRHTRSPSVRLSAAPTDTAPVCPSAFTRGARLSVCPPPVCTRGAGSSGGDRRQCGRRLGAEGRRRLLRADTSRTTRCPVRGETLMVITDPKTCSVRRRDRVGSERSGLGVSAPPALYICIHMYRGSSDAACTGWPWPSLTGRPPAPPVWWVEWSYHSGLCLTKVWLMMHARHHSSLAAAVACIATLPASRLHTAF